MRRGRGSALLLLALLAAASSFSVAAAPPAPGSQVPDFELKDPSGGTLRLSSLRGEVVVLHFWATWCPHCLAEMPVLAEAARDPAFRGVRILAVNLGEPAKVVSRYLRSHSLDLPVLLDSRGKVAAAYGVVGLPVSLIVDASGKLVRQISMGSLSRDELAGSLAPLLETKGGEGKGEGSPR